MSQICKYLIELDKACGDIATHNWEYKTISRYGTLATELIGLCDKHNQEMDDKGYLTIPINKINWSAFEKVS